MASEWIVLNSVQERDEGADPDYPWYPSINAPAWSVWLSLEIWFATEEECRDFIKENILGAPLEEEQ
ncbi:hypothetical protein ABZ353_10950 [Streptomyces niveus]|uniref:hypothetical protein n=1 Tax=Streptomyces niveus TaxID=193462 RepID=UPI0033C52EA3